MNQKDFLLFMNQLPAPSFFVNNNLEFVFLNHRFENLLGYQSENLSGISMKTLLQANATDDSIEKFLNECTAASNDFNKTIALRFKTDKENAVLVTATSGAIDMGDAQGWLFTLQQTKESSSQKLESSAQQALSTWNIGVFHNDHITGEVLTSDDFDNLFALEGGEKLTLQNLAQSVSPADLKIIEEAIAKAYDPEGDGLYDLEYQYITSRGDIRWLHSRCKTAFEEINGERIPVYTLGTVRDVTEQKEVDLALSRNQERLAQAIEVAQVGIFEDDHIESPTATNLYWSPLFREMLGIDENHPASMAWYESFIPAEDVMLVRTAQLQSHDIEGDGYYEVEHRWMHPDGKLRWFSLQGKTFFEELDRQRTPILTVGAVIDVTERKIIEDEIRKRTAILESTPDFVGITDLAGNLMYLNKSGRDIVGVNSDADISGINMESLHTVESTKIIVDEGIPSAISYGSWTSEQDFYNHDGKTIPMSELILAHKDNDGEVAYFSVVARDLSKEKALEEQFYQAQKMEAIGRLAGGIAHDFNNMLSVIMGFTSLAANKLDAHHEGHKQLDQVLKASQKAAALTEHLLAFSRKQIMQSIVLDVNEIIEGMELIIDRLVDDNILVDIIPADFPCCIKADPIQIEQMFLNLIVNARDAMTKGGELIIETQKVIFEGEQVADRLDLHPGAYIMIAVSDTGAGMDSETVEKVFEPFFTTKELHQGTGLGLATVYGIVKQSGGTIWVYSEPGEGTVFKSYFPCTDEALTIPKHTPEEVQKNPDGVVLVTEDEPQVRAMVLAVLESAGYTVLNASDGEEALTIADNHQGVIDLLLTDVVMPKMSGKVLADTLLKKRPETQVLFMSGYTENSIVHHGVLDDDVNFLAKPLMPNKLLKKVAQLLGNNSSV